MGSKLGVQRARLHSRDSLELADAGRVSSKRLSRRRRRNESHTSQDLPRCSSDQLTTNTQSARSVTHMRSRSTSPHPPPPRRDLVRRLSSTSSAQRIPAAATTPATRRSRTSSAAATAPMDAKQRRILEAERILDEIANEYAAKRAAGLVPTMPVPARTLLWEELARNERNRIGSRGQCLFGRDTDSLCGCTSYKKKKVPGQSNPGGVCECCNHGGPWHRLHGGGMTTTMTSRGRSSGGTARNSTRTASLVRSEGRAASVYSYQSEDYGDDDYEDEDDSDYDSDDSDDEDDEDIANEVARPYVAAVSPRMPPPGYMLASPRMPMSPQVPLTPTALRTPTLAERNSLPDRSSIFSTRSSLGLPPRLSNQSNRLEVLLKAIEGYRSMGLSEDEVEDRIREDFPPVDRLSVSTSNRSFALGSM